MRACTLCAAALPLGPRPIVQLDAAARIVVASQAPGRRAHLTGVPFRDASGERLRHWTGIAIDDFYDPAKVAIVPMGMCYPGRAASGDRPPRPECAPHWRARLLAALRAPRLTLVVGRHALGWHLPDERDGLTEAVRRWRRHGPATFVLPHPSPLNNGWLRRNPWFDAEVVPALRERVAAALRS